MTVVDLLRRAPQARIRPGEGRFRSPRTLPRPSGRSDAPGTVVIITPPQAPTGSSPGSGQAQWCRTTPSRPPGAATGRPQELPRWPETTSPTPAASRTSAEDDLRVRNWARNATLGPAGSVGAPRTRGRAALAARTSTEGGVRVIGSRMSPGRMLSLAAPGRHAARPRATSRGLARARRRTARPSRRRDHARRGVRQPQPPTAGCCRPPPASSPPRRWPARCRPAPTARACGRAASPTPRCRVRMVLADGSVAEFDAAHPLVRRRQARARPARRRHRR